MINIIYFKGKSNFINLYILIPRYASEPSPQAFTVRTSLRIWTFAYFTDKSLCTRPRFPGLQGKRIPAYNLRWNSYYPRESQNFWHLFQWFLDSGWKGMFTYFTVHSIYLVCLQSTWFMAVGVYMSYVCSPKFTTTLVSNFRRRPTQLAYLMTQLQVPAIYFESFKNLEPWW